MKCNSMKDCHGQSCIFCEIVNRQTETEILIRDEELCCFRDLNPGAEHHYLVVPNIHIDSCISLMKEHVPMVKEMVKMAKAVLLKHNFNNLDDIRLGFHIPPFYSVHHLHLHVLAPASQMDIHSLWTYGPQAFWFITAEDLIQKLNNQFKPSALIRPCTLI
ncbi:hypothetical protein COCON_G00093360 [Conger conger]|uniref:Adenosine 5'-monophosphoramidase HINT3 n=1 Tax=Conger conger TaxID=82655 RepID=A0A9Q1DMF2_CONCO|nr:hypothetical protein COCON_G00093360 [Conger conger]